MPIYVKEFNIPENGKCEECDAYCMEEDCYCTIFSENVWTENCGQCKSFLNSIKQGKLTKCTMEFKIPEDGDCANCDYFYWMETGIGNLDIPYCRKFYTSVSNGNCHACKELLKGVI